MDKRIIDVACAIIEKDGGFLLARIAEGRLRSGQWEFPGGKIDRLETEKDALVREIKEELGIEVTAGQRLTANLYVYEDCIVNLIPYRCTITSGDPHPREHAQIDWVTADRAEAYELVPADREILREYLALIARHR